MYNYCDDNTELTTVEPEYSAMYCSDKYELTIFYNNMIDESHDCASLSEAESLFDEWCDKRRSE